MSITDTTEFVPQRHRQPPRLVEPQMRPTDEEISEVVGRPVASVLIDTDLQRIGALVVALTYADMKTLAAGVLGADAKPDEVIALADKFHAWASATVPS